MCHNAVKAKKRINLDRMSVPLHSGLKDMEKSLFGKLSFLKVDILYTDAQQGTLSWPSID